MIKEVKKDLKELVNTAISESVTGFGSMVVEANPGIFIEILKAGVSIYIAKTELEMRQSAIPDLSSLLTPIPDSSAGKPE